MLRKLWEDVEKSQETIYKQNGDINKDIRKPEEKLSDISELKSTIIKNEKFTREIQRQI